jgi:hypothetical protein
VTTGPGIVLLTLLATVPTTLLALRRRTRNRAIGGHDEPAGFLIATERV